MNQLKKSSKSQAQVPENPYLNSRRAWNAHVAGIMHSLQLWQVTAIVSLLITVVAVGGVIQIGSQSKFIPLVFQQDASGNVLSVTRADKVEGASHEDYQTVAARFIENSRLVTADVELQKKAVLQTYAYLAGNDPAVAKAQAYFNGSAEVNPFNRAANELVSVEIHSVLQETEATWQVDWIERSHNRDGSLKGKPQRMKALLTLYQNLNLNEASNEMLLRNPHFIFVRDFNWSKDLEPGVNP